MMGSRSSTAWFVENDDAFELPLPDEQTGQCRPGATPVYRLWNQRVDSNHRYTTSAAIRQSMIARAWLPEGYGPDGVALWAAQ